MQTKLTTLCLLIAIGLGFYCANMSGAVRQLREHTARLDEEASKLREHIGRLQQDRLLRDWLFERRGPTFQLPPSKGVQIRLAFTVDGKTDSIELLRRTPGRRGEREQEYTLLKQFDDVSKTWKFGFLARAETEGSIVRFRSISHPLLTTEELGFLLTPTMYSGFGKKGGVGRRADGRIIESWYEVSEWDGTSTL